MSSSNAFELYGRYKGLYLFNTGKGSVLFKPLTYEQSQTAKKICSNFPALAPVVEDNIWEECVIEHTLPGSIEDLNAGIVSTIVRLIISFSNPSSLSEISQDLEKIRNETLDIREEIIIKICQAFPAYKPEEIENMEWEVQLKRLIQAEKILGHEFSFTKKEKEREVTLPAPNGPSTKVGSDGNHYIDFEKENAALM